MATMDGLGFEIPAPTIGGVLGGGFFSHSLIDGVSLASVEANKQQSVDSSGDA
jgi:hypothetical protein